MQSVRVDVPQTFNVFEWDFNFLLLLGVYNF